MRNEIVNLVKEAMADELLRKDGEFCRECSSHCKAGGGNVCLEYLLEVLMNRFGLSYGQCLEWVRRYREMEESKCRN